MSNLDLIRTLRRALAGLRDAPDPSAVNHIARALVVELETKLGQLSLSDHVRAFDDVAGEAVIRRGTHPAREIRTAMLARVVGSGNYQ